MALGYSLKSLPELRDWSWKDRCQAMWQAGLRPLQRWPVWVGMATCSLIVLCVLDAILGGMVARTTPDPWGTSIDYGAALHVALYTVLALLFAGCLPAMLVWRVLYLQAMRPLVGGIFPNPDASAAGAAVKAAAMHLLFLLLTVAWVVGLDCAINSFDEALDSRIAKVLAWPPAIPDHQNGYVAMTGLRAPVGTDPLTAGSRWVTAVNNALKRGVDKIPEAPEALTYVSYRAPDQPQAKKKSDWVRPCDFGKEDCLPIVHARRQAIAGWLGANREPLARYRALATFPTWQTAIRVGPADGPMPPMADYTPMMQGQDLLLIAVMRTADDGKTDEALAMLETDIRFTRRMLAARINLLGKMIASAMLARDLSVLAELIEHRPGALVPYWPRLNAMLAPLTPTEVSCGVAFRFEQRWFISTVPSHPTLDDVLPQGVTAPALLQTPWTPLHYKRNATANLVLHYLDAVIGKAEVSDASFTPPLQKAAMAPLQGMSPVTGFMHNQIGKTIGSVSLPRPVAYINKVRDLNALNNLVRLRMLIARDGIPAAEVPACLTRGDAPRNPETGKPFEWDAKEKLIYFSPSVESFKKHYPGDSGELGRTGLRVTASAIPLS